MSVCDEPTSITDAYALIKLLSRDHGVSRFRVLANMVHSPRKVTAFNKLLQVTDRFRMWPCSMCAVPYDESVRKSAQKQRATLDLFPRSKMATAIRTIARKVDAWPLPSTPRGHLEFFIERLVQRTGMP